MLNEIIVKDITAQDVFENLIDTSIWATYYNNVADIYPVEVAHKLGQKNLPPAQIAEAFFYLNRFLFLLISSPINIFPRRSG